MLISTRSILFMSAPALTLLCLSLLSFICLSSTTVSAEETLLDNVDISVPVSCNLNSSVDAAHTAIVNAGTSVSDIGTTNFTVFCNDASGFALYAIGYTNEDDGDNTLVGQTTSNIINTGQATSGNTSAWAMKMIKVTDGSYQPNNLTITNNFNSYHNVPDTYTKVAEYTASTDTTLGSKLQSTYQAFMSTYQDADTYNGKVKYTLVHPYDSATPRPRVTKSFEITYNSGALYFDEERTKTQNIVSYSATCEPKTRQFNIVKTSNLNDFGIKNTAYTTENVFNNAGFIYQGADKLKIILNYGFTANTAEVYIGGDNDQSYNIHPENNEIGEETFIINGDWVSISFYTFNTENLANGYDYGAYAVIYPLDENDNEISFEMLDCDWITTSGTYLEPLAIREVGWFERWYIDDDPWISLSNNQQSVFWYLEENFNYYDKTNSITIDSASVW